MSKNIYKKTKTQLLNRCCGTDEGTQPQLFLIHVSSFFPLIPNICVFCLAVITHGAVGSGFAAFKLRVYSDTANCGKSLLCQGNPITGSEYLNSNHVTLMWRAAQDLKR